MKEFVKRIFTSKNLIRSMVGAAYTKPGLSKAECMALNRIFNDKEANEKSEVSTKVISIQKTSLA